MILKTWRAMPALVEEQSRALRTSLREALDDADMPMPPEAERECFIFVLWSVHICLMNMRPGMSRTVLQWLHERRIKRVGKGDGRLLAHYRRRRIEALYVVRNVMLERDGPYWAPPLSTRSARMFLDKAFAEKGQLPMDVVHSVLRSLKQSSSACAQRLLAA
ncbi:hypothetical protein SAMN02927924_02154 [Sphingobium faniae]|nr:hypothetical protein SAMN02927924_02154 [Sphingobium faniae]